MKLLLMIIVAGFLLPTVRCRTSLQKSAAPRREILLASNNELKQPGFECPGGVSGLLTKYLGQRKVAPEKASLVILGHCGSDRNFNHELARDIKGTPTTIMTISDRYVEQIQDKIFRNVVLYYCQDLYKRKFKNPVRHVEKIYSFKPYVLFTISNPPILSYQKLASVQFCELEFDYIIRDMLSTRGVEQTELLPQSRARPSVKVCNVWHGVIQTDFSIQLLGMITDTSNCTNVSNIDNVFEIAIKAMSLTEKVLFGKKVGTLDEQFALSLQTVCLEPLAIVEPSEWVFIEPLSGPFVTVILGTILAVCLLSSLGFVREFNSLLYQIISSVLTPQSVVVPHLAGLFKFQRLLFMGLFIVLFQFVIVDNFRTEVTTALLEPQRDLKIFKRDKNIVDMFTLYWLPSRMSSTHVKSRVYSACIIGAPFCYGRPDVIQEGLNIPLARSHGPTIPYKMEQRAVYGDFLKPSVILRTINEYGLMALTRGYNRRFLFNRDFTTAPLVKTNELFHRVSIPDARWSPGKHWEASVEVLEKCFGTKTCGLYGGTQRIVTKKSDLSPVFRMKHLQGTIRICSVLLLTSIVILIGEVIWSYLHNAKRRNRVSVNVRAN